jgi:HAD superfamily hydrolase (TIGR01509 family)
MGRVKAVDLDAVTLDAYGTLAALRDPVPELVAVLADRGIERTPDVVRASFHAEAAYYGPRAGDGHDEPSLAQLRRDCASVFLEAVQADLDPGEFAPVYVEALRFEVLPGVLEALKRLRALGLALGVVANWDFSLRERLEELGLARHFAVVVHAARKPSAAGLVTALRELGVEPTRALHIGDDAADEEAAHAAGMHFASAPLPPVISTLA